MKRLLLAVSLAALSAPAWADTARPELPLKYIPVASHPSATPPYNAADDAPVVQDSDLDLKRIQLAQSGNTRSDLELAARADPNMTEQNPWANDHNFIAPPP